MADDPLHDSSTATATAMAPAPSGASDSGLTARLCPYLSSADGDWRTALPTREHRCTAVEPPVSPSVDKQRRLCLTADHGICATYLAARRTLLASEEASVEEAPHDAAPALGSSDGPPLRWALPRTAPVVVDRGRPSLRAVLGHRSVTQLSLVLLMALAFLVLVLARVTAGPGSTDRVETSPSPPAASTQAGVSVGASPATSSAPASVPPSQAASSPAASVTSAPKASGAVGTRTYRVVGGDTLGGIAARFGVTVAALQQANGIKDPSKIRVGTVLVIP